MKKMIFLLLLIAGSVSALEIKSAAVKFTAFKTYAKKGVSGVFDHVSLTTNKGNDIVTVLKNTTAVIDTSSVNSGNRGRDAKLVSKFFEVQGVKAIDAKIINVKKDTLLVAISMNDKTLNIPMSYSAQNNSVIAKGTIDLADFAMLPSLKSINKACYTLHQGKTWQDVVIYLTVQYK